MGEKLGPDTVRWLDRFAPVDNGDALRPTGLTVRDEDTRYRGGVTYWDPGVAEFEADGFSPRRERCVGVRGISARSSCGRKRGYNATKMFRTKKSCKPNSDRSGYEGLSLKTGSHDVLLYPQISMTNL